MTLKWLRAFKNGFGQQVLIIFSYIFTGEMEELFNYAEEIFNLAFQLSLAYIASLIFFLIVNYFPEKKKKDRYRCIGFRQLKFPLNRHVRLYQYMYKTTIDKRPENKFIFPKQMINDSLIESLREFDFSSRAPVTTSETWLTYIAKEFKVFYDELKEILLKYAYYFEDDEIELIEEISNSFIMHLFINRGDVRQFDGHAWYHIDDSIDELKSLGNQNKSLFKPSKDGRDFLKEYLKSILNLIDIYERNTKTHILIDDKLWSESIAPTYKNYANKI